MALDPALHVTVSGPALPAATVVFVHGIGDNHETWELQRAALDSTSVRHVAYDHRGFGRSEARTARRVTITDLARDLGAVIDDQPDAPIILVGHSMGTMTIQALAAARPDLFLARVAGVLLLAGPGAGREIAGGIPLPVARVVSGSVRRGLFLAAGLPSRSPFVRGIVALMVEAAYGPRGDRTMRAAVRTRVAGVSTRTLVTHVDACLTFHA
ncbi:alpha/beta fold hydrolase, partial [Nocardioides stalactiti]|uniref:alpha/beta fold hydrolase n=1 Tax=Nocardioides stalactiti TaxID=2755356 RepID=UPI0015FEEE95